MYNFDLDTPKELVDQLAERFQKRRLEKGLSRAALTAMSGVPVPTITKFEKEHSISLVSFVALAKAMDYSEEVKSLFGEPKYSTIEELDEINKNKNRKRGRR